MTPDERQKLAETARVIDDAYGFCVETDNWPEGFDPFDAIGDLLNMAHDFQRQLEQARKDIKWLRILIGRWAEDYPDSVTDYDRAVLSRKALEDAVDAALAATEAPEQP